MTDTTTTPTPQAYNKTIREWIDRHDINFGTFDEARAAFEDAAARAMESRALAAEAEVSRLRGSVKWQPMETAPKDRKAVLVYCAEHRNAYAVWWDSEAKVWLHFSPCFSRLTETPTAWMPLPTPDSGGPHA